MSSIAKIETKCIFKARADTCSTCEKKYVVGALATCICDSGERKIQTLTGTAKWKTNYDSKTDISLSDLYLWEDYLLTNQRFPKPFFAVVEVTHYHYIDTLLLDVSHIIHQYIGPRFNARLSSHHLSNKTSSETHDRVIYSNRPGWNQIIIKCRNEDGNMILIDTPIP